MSLALLRKELSEHGAVLGATLLLAALGLLVLNVRSFQTAGRFLGLTLFAAVFGTLLAMVLANRLLAREYSGHTQLFLETLPIGRAVVFATKWLLGCVLICIVTVLAWRVSLASIHSREVLTLADALGPLACAITFCVTVWSFAALAAMLGRFRYIPWILVGFVLFVANAMAGVPMLELPVLRLLGEDVQMARGMPALSVFVVAWSIAGACLLAAAFLAVWGSGAMASALARRMTARERVFVIVSIIATLAITSFLDRQPPRPPFAIRDGVRFDGRFVTAAVMPTVDLDAATARRLARTIAGDADKLIEQLDLNVAPPVFVLPQHGLDRFALQVGSTGNASGIVLKVAPDAPEDLVRTLVLHSLLTDATHRRAMRDDHHVFVDGLASYWAVRDDAEARERWWLRAAAVDAPLDSDELVNWSQTSERYGDCVSLAIAFDVVDTLIAMLGQDQALALLREILHEPADNATVLLEPGVAALLEDAGVSWQGLAGRADAARRAARDRYRESLAARAEVTADASWQESPGRGIEIETTVEGVPRYAVYYGQIHPWAAALGTMPRYDVRGAAATLPLSPPHGGRVFVAIEHDDPVLECPVRVLAERLELR